MDIPLISVIVPVYKVEAYLPRCVDSILAQTYPNLEIFLVDDGSPDGCGKLCDDYARMDSRIRVIHKHNGGLSSARNAAIDVASGDYLSFVDSDDWIEPEMYEKMVSAAQKYNVKLVCAGRYDVDDATLQRTKGLCPEREEVVSGQELVRRIFLWDHLDSAAWDKLYDRRLFDGIRYPDGRVVEDVPTTYRLALRAGETALLAQPFYNYRHRENSITTAKITEKSFHGFQHAGMVYADIRSNLPELEKYARYFLTISAKYLVRLMDNADAFSRDRFYEEYWAARNELRDNLWFVCTSQLFSRRDKLEITLLAWGLYPGMRKLYHMLKRRKNG